MAIFDPTESTNQVIPAGEYILEIYDTKRWDTTGNISTGKSPTPCLSLKYKVLAGEHKDEKSQENFFYEKAHWKLSHFMVQAGIGKGKFETNDEEQTKIMFVGKRFVTALGVREYNGKEYNEIDLNTLRELDNDQSNMVANIEISVPKFEEYSGSSDPGSSADDSDDIPF